MNKRLKKIIVVLILILMICFILTSKSMAVNNMAEPKGTANLGYNDLTRFTNLLCIANGYALSGTTVKYNVSHTVNITPETPGKSNAKMAYFAWYASNQENTSGENYKYSQSQNAIWRYWKTWYDANNSLFSISPVFNIKSNPDSSSAADTLEEAAEKYYNILNSNDGITIKNAKSKATVDTYNNKNYTYIGPFTIKVDSGYDNYINNCIKGISIDGVTIKGYSTKGVGKSFSSTLPSVGTKFWIVCDSGVSVNKNTDIILKSNIYTYSATMKLLYSRTAGRTWQNLLWVDGTKGNKDINTTFNIGENGEQDISLQKYIVGVNGVNNISTEYRITTDEANTGRRNLIANSERTDYEYINISTYNNNSVSSAHNDPMYYKINKPVTIAKGDEVVYKIVVYNNGTEATNKGIIRDRISSQGTLKGIYKKYNGNGLEGLDGVIETDVGDDMVAESTSGDSAAYRTTESHKYYKWNLYQNDDEGDMVIPAGEYIQFFVVVQYNNYFTGKIANKAYITSSNASESRRTVDYDYIQMKQADVSLQKYITQVNGTNVNSRINRRADSRSIDIIYKNSNGTVQGSIGTYKSLDVVEIEVGDYVTYNIIVYNNTSTTVNNVTILDEIPEGVTKYKWGVYNDNATYSNVPADGRILSEYVSINGWGQKIFTITLYFGEYKSDVLENIASIYDTEMGNNTQYRTVDADYVQMKPYNVKLEKYVYRTGATVSQIKAANSAGTYETQRSGKPEYGSHSGGSNNYKYNNPVTVSNGRVVQYAIKVTNEGETQVFINKLTDVLPEGLEYAGDISGYIYNGSGRGRKSLSVDYNISNGTIEIKNSIRDTDILLNQNEGIKILIMARVTEPNISTRVLKNTAELEKVDGKYAFYNKNGSYVYDECQNDDKDSDYIQLYSGDKDIVISGTVWNDMDHTKNSENNYDGKYNKDNEKTLSDIYVALYRYDGDTNILISSKYTDENGYYYFCDDDINKKYYKGSNIGVDISTLPIVNYGVNNDYEKYLKGPRDASNKKWTGEYYSYYIIFTYDGITYTTTPDGQTYVKVDNQLPQNYQVDSNASETLKDRTNFNKNFSTINNEHSIKNAYETKNESGYIPQSIHNSNKNSSGFMNASTNLITLSKDANLEEISNFEKQLKYVGLGLRGRDIFDLELTSDVSQIDIKVNNQPGTYKYTNKVTIQRSDLSSKYAYDEDMANTYLEGSDYKEGGEQYLNIRKGDLDPANHAEITPGYYKYDNQKQALEEIKVTYKITVTNASKTDGTATKVINYFDSRYTFEKAYVGNYVATIEEGAVYGESDNSSYNSVIITTPGTNITQSQPMEIYVVYSLKTPTTTLASLLNGTEKIATYNMAEVYEYSTQCAEGQTEFTRGLIDKDSAPGSANREQVRTTKTEGQNTKTISGNPTTVQYYFKGDALSELKYEDDTYATPTLYFTTPEDNTYDRKISGTVFEDYTVIVNNNEDRTKTGDGIQNNNEPGIKGVKVILLEYVKKESIYYPRYRDYTDENGNFEFSGLLPGTYHITYDYGINDDTFLYDNNPNTKSYNGEDFQSTNNTYEINGVDVKILNRTNNYWYAFNKSEGISCATDRTQKREDVSKYVTSLTDEKMEVLNDARDGKTMEYFEKMKTEEIAKEVRDKTFMTAQTDNMLLTVEETVDFSKMANNRELMEKGMLTPIGNNSLGQWTVFPNKDSDYKSYNVSNMNFGIAEVPVTTIDLQKHVNSFTIKDSSGENTLASAQIDEDNTSVTVNPSKIASNRIDTVINVLSETLDIKEDKIKQEISYEENKDNNIDIVISENVKKDDKENLEKEINRLSLSREISILNAWKVTTGNVLTAPGASVMDVSIEDERLQGAKLEVTYTISSKIYTEKNYNYNGNENTEKLITGLVDYVDNDLSYNESLGENKKYWEVTAHNATLSTFNEASFKDLNGNSVECTGGYIDGDGNRQDVSKHTTILKAKEDNPILNTEGGEATITLERVLSSTDSNLASIITSNIDSFEYNNIIEITGLDYESTKTKETGEFIFRDRIRKPNRYIILAGAQHDYAISETIAIHPPTGDSRLEINYYIIAALSLGILSVGIILIKKYVIKSTK